jgi:hypothetical protein
MIRKSAPHWRSQLKRNRNGRERSRTALRFSVPLATAWQHGLAARSSVSTLIFVN